MEWKRLIIYATTEAIDPGIVHRETKTSEFAPDELHVGESVKYKDPTCGDLANIKVAAMDENGVTLMVGKTKEVRLWPGESAELSTGARDYSYFYLSAELEPSYDKDTLMADDEVPDDDGRYDAWA